MHEVAVGKLKINCVEGNCRWNALAPSIATEKSGNDENSLLLKPSLQFELLSNCDLKILKQTTYSIREQKLYTHAWKRLLSTMFSFGPSLEQKLYALAWKRLLSATFSFGPSSRPRM